MNVYILVGWHKNVFISFVENWILGIRREGSQLDLYEVYFSMSVGWWRQKSSMFYILNTLRSVEVDVLFSSYAVILLLKLHFHLKPTNYSNYILLGPKESRTKGWIKKNFSLYHPHPHICIWKNSLDNISTYVRFSSSRSNNDEANVNIIEKMRMRHT